MRIISERKWQSYRLQWKFKNDYEEFREHLKSAFLILFGWAVTLNHLRTVATRHFIVSQCRVSASPQTDGFIKNDPIRSVVGIYEESGNLAPLGIRPTSIWNFLVTLFR